MINYLKMNSKLEDLLSTCSVIDNKYFVLKKIGSGATCVVKLAKDLNNKIFAIKILKKNLLETNTIKNFESEINLLTKINHKHIINIIEGKPNGVLKKPSGEIKFIDYIVLEYASNGEFFDYIYFPKKGFGERYGKYLFYQILNGLEAVHDAGVVHRDLKTENILLADNFDLKIADFGYATLLSGKSGDGILTTSLGTISYAAPEILLRIPYIGTYVDVFSLGVILFIIVTGKMPFGKAVTFDPFYKFIVKNDYESFWGALTPKIELISDQLKTLLNNMLAFDPTQRPSLAEIKSHLWMLQDFPTNWEVEKELKTRKLIIQKYKQLEKLKFQQDKCNVQTNNIGGVYRSELNNEFLEYKNEDISRVLQEYVETNNPYLILVNNLVEPMLLLETIYNYFLNTRNDLKISIAAFSKKKYLMILKLNSNICSTSDCEINTMDSEIELEFAIKKYNDDNVAIEILRQSGDKFLFNEEFDKIVKFFDEYK